MQFILFLTQEGIKPCLSVVNSLNTIKTMNRITSGMHDIVQLKAQVRMLLPPGKSLNQNRLANGHKIIFRFLGRIGEGILA